MKDYEKREKTKFYFDKLSGFFLLGFIPFMASLLFAKMDTIAFFTDMYIVDSWSAFLFWFVFISALSIPINLYVGRTKSNLAQYPQMRLTKWRSIDIKQYFGAWTIYLFGYEVLFRALLFFPFIEILGLWPAIILNTVLYSATHIQKGINESLGSIPFGLAVTYACYASGSIWIAFMTHILVCYVNNGIALKYNPDMEIIKGKPVTDTK